MTWTWPSSRALSPPRMEAETVRSPRESVGGAISAVGAATGRHPGMAEGFLGGPGQVFGVPSARGDMAAPRPVGARHRRGLRGACVPIDPMDFVRALEPRSTGAGRIPGTVCAASNPNERAGCSTRGQLCLGLRDPGRLRGEVPNAGLSVQAGGSLPIANLAPAG